VEPFMWLRSSGKFIQLPVKIRLGRNHIIVTNALAYYNTELITDVKNFFECCKTFYGRNLLMFLINQFLSLARLSSLVYCLWVRPSAQNT